MLIVSRQEREMPAAERRDCAEIAFVEGQQAGGAEPSRQDDNRGVGQPELEVDILLVQPCGQCVFVSGQPLHQKSPRRDVT